MQTLEEKTTIYKAWKVGAVTELKSMSGVWHEQQPYKPLDVDGIGFYLECEVLDKWADHITEEDKEWADHITEEDKEWARSVQYRIKENA